MLYFYKQYFISISLSSTLDLIAGICVFFVSKVGWEKSNNAVINIFFITAGAAILYQKLPELFQQGINLTSNKNLYLQYLDLRNKTLSYIATGTLKY